jgi:hypothetical protein
MTNTELRRRQAQYTKFPAEVNPLFSTVYTFNVLKFDTQYTD